MNICILTTSLPVHQMGGTEVQAEALAAETARQGHKVFVITTAHPRGLKSEERGGFTVIYLEGTSYTMSRREAPAWWRGSARRTAELCEAEKIDVVWAENFAGLAYAALPRPTRRPVISVVNGLAVKGEIASNFNRVSTPGELFWFLTRYAAQTLLYYIPRFRALVRDSDLLVGISHATTEALLAEFPSAAGKVVTILCPLDTGLFKPDPFLREKSRKAFGYEAGQTVILMSGVLHKQKGLHLGMRAFSSLAAEFPEARLLIVGDGPQRRELEELSIGLGLKGRTIFCGNVPNKDMPAVYNAADIYLMPTLRFEGLGIVLIEAMSCGIPVIASKIGGTASTIDSGRSGFFTGPGNMEEMTSALRRLIADPRLRSEFASAARKKAVDHFAKEKAVAAYIAASRTLLLE